MSIIKGYDEIALHPFSNNYRHKAVATEAEFDRMRGLFPNGWDIDEFVRNHFWGKEGKKPLPKVPVPGKNGYSEIDGFVNYKMESNPEADFIYGTALNRAKKYEVRFRDENEILAHRGSIGFEYNDGVNDVIEVANLKDKKKKAKVLIHERLAKDFCGENRTPNDHERLHTEIIKATEKEYRQLLEQCQMAA